MAHRESIQNEYIKLLLDGASFFWNISDRVGYGYPSRYEDVLLVQFLLNTHLRTMRKDNAFGEYFKGIPYLVMDGKFGGKTWAQIKEFQKLVFDGTDEAENYADGMVSSANGMVSHSPKKKIIYTIYRLNMQYIAYYRMYFKELWRDPMFPQQLRSHLWGPLPQLM